MRTPFQCQPPQSMIVAGIMSGTSADGVDVALCRISPTDSTEPNTPPAQVEVLAHRAFPYAADIRAAVLVAMEGRALTPAEWARLSWRLGEIYADAAATLLDTTGLHAELVAMHGQTIFHGARAADFLGSPIRATWQLGEPSVLAERLRLPIASDFRPADLAAGGQGAPLVPMLDFCVFSHPSRHRLLLNLGGIANITALPAGGTLDDVLAFDTGPANMVIDACMSRLFGRAYDCSGGTAAKGVALDAVVAELIAETVYFAAPPPKSCGREQFGAAFADRLIARCRAAGAGPKDILATATALTAQTVLDATRRFCLPRFAAPAQATELFAAGGGAHNAELLRRLHTGFATDGVSLATTTDAGLAVEAKEAAAFALLGWLRWFGLPGNVPSATGARRAVPLGKVTLP